MALFAFAKRIGIGREQLEAARVGEVRDNDREISPLAGFVDEEGPLLLLIELEESRAFDLPAGVNELLQKETSRQSDLLGTLDTFIKPSEEL